MLESSTSKTTRLTIAGIFLFALCACASAPTSRFGSEPHLNSNADAASYAAEGFTYSKDMPIHPNSPYRFYFRGCELDDGKVYYSKTSYACNMIP